MQRRLASRTSLFNKLRGWQQPFAAMVRTALAATAPVHIERRVSIYMAELLLTPVLLPQV
jgi:hypothetical protein